MKPLLGVSALVLNIIGYYPYYREILNKVVKPQRTTWGIWSILAVIAAVNQVKNGGGFSSLFVVSSAILVGITFLLSIKYGHGGASKLDIVCLVLSLLLLAYWALAGDTRTSTLIVILIDSIALTPTLKKTYLHPSTEIYFPWMMASLSATLTVIAVPKLDWALIIYPLYIFIGDFSVIAIKYSREK